MSMSTFAEKGFIYELIRLIGQHDCKMEDIRQLIFAVQ